MPRSGNSSVALLSSAISPLDISPNHDAHASAICCIRYRNPIPHSRSTIHQPTPSLFICIGTGKHPDRNRNRSKSRMSSSSSNFLDLYEPLDIIGNGSFGIIRKVRRKSDGVVRTDHLSLRLRCLVLTCKYWRWWWGVFRVCGGSVDELCFVDGRRWLSVVVVVSLGCGCGCGRGHAWCGHCGGVDLGSERTQL